jgi:predicted TIM-barrel fold metal-dependent hydrolase
VPIIDSHAHLKHGDAAGTEYGADQIVSAMDAAGIDRSVVFAMSTGAHRAVEMAEAAVEEFPERLIPYAYAIPGFEGPVLPTIAGAVRDLGFRGIKMHAAECRMVDYVADPVFGLAGELGVPVLVDFAGDARAPERIATAFPDTTLIIAHLGQYRCSNPDHLDRFIRIAEGHSNVYLDASGVLLDWKIEDAVRRVGSGRVLFGTDGPHPCPDEATFARREVDRIRALDLTEEERDDVLGRSLARLLGL